MLLKLPAYKYLYVGRPARRRLLEKGLLAAVRAFPWDTAYFTA